MRGRLEDSHKEGLDERRRYDKIFERICPGERRTILQDARRNLVEVCGARRGPKKVEGST